MNRVIAALILIWATTAQAQLEPFPGFPIPGFEGQEVPQAQPATVNSVTSAINPNCALTFVLSNSCANGTLALLAYYAPTHWCECTGRTNVAVVQGQTPLNVLGGLGSPNPAISGGGASNATQGGEGQTNKQFKECRCYEMPTQLSRATCGVCDGESSSAFQVNYVSDSDAQWRTLSTTPIPGVTGSGPPSPTDFGVWCSIYPRHGFVIHSSEVAAAACMAGRAMHIANQPFEISGSLRPVQKPSPAPPTCFQVAHPRQSQCLPMGASPIYFETFRLEPEGKYVFIHWTIKACCVDEGTARLCESQNSGWRIFAWAGRVPWGLWRAPYPLDKERTLKWIVVFLVLGLVSCSGGGSGSGDGDGDGNGTTPINRETEFQEEALQRVLDQVTVTCEEISCPLADFERERESVINPGVWSTACFYDCVEVELPGEVREYTVRLIWERFSTGCYELEDHILRLNAQRITKCVPNF